MQFMYMSPYCGWAAALRHETQQPVAPQQPIMNGNRWKSLTFGVSEKQDGLVVRLQVGEEEEEEEVGGTYVCILTADLYLWCLPGWRSLFVSGATVGHRVFGTSARLLSIAVCSSGSSLRVHPSYTLSKKKEPASKRLCIWFWFVLLCFWNKLPPQMRSKVVTLRPSVQHGFCAWMNCLGIWWMSYIFNQTWRTFVWRHKH